MENVFDCEGSSVAYGVTVASTDLKDEFIMSLTSFVRLYSQRRDRLQKASESFALTAARLHEMQEDISENQVSRGLFGVFGEVLVAVCGGVAGGALGAVSAATCTRFCVHINTVGGTLGFFGSVFGGVVGGTYCGAFGGAVCAAAEAHGVVSTVAWFTVHCATGGAIGDIFGGTVGAVGAVVGGAFGALYATRFAVCLVGRIAGRFCKDLKEHKTKSMKVDMMQKSSGFSKAIKPLVEEMKTIMNISDKMASSAVVHGVAAQTATALTSVTTMQKMISDAQRTTDRPQFVSCVEEAATQSRKVTEELQEARAEVVSGFTEETMRRTAEQELDKT